MLNIKVQNLNKSFSSFRVLKDVSLQISSSQVISIIGPSGSGKSTLLRTIQGLEEYDSGLITFDNHPANREIMKRVGMVFQGFNLFPHKTVLENLIEAPIIVNAVDRPTAIADALILLEKVGLSDKKDAYPSSLSGGQKQRVAIARALAMKPDVLLFDEPTSALDPELVGEVLNVIQDLASDNMTMIIVTHEMNFAREVSDYIVFMDGGEILEVMPPNQFFDNPSNHRVKSFIDKIL